MLSDQRLDDIFANFYLEIRNKNGQLYKKSKMKSYRQGLQRHLNQNRDIIDNLKGGAFKKIHKGLQVYRKGAQTCRFGCHRTLSINSRRGSPKDVQLFFKKHR